LAPSFFELDEAVLDEVLLANFIEGEPLGDPNLMSVGRTASAP
jgi:hypothetical protein